MLLTSAGYVYIINPIGQIIYTYNFDNVDLNGWNISMDLNNNLFFINGQQNTNNYLFIVNYKTNIINTVSLPSNGLYSTPIKVGNYVYQGTESNGLCKIDINSSTVIDETNNGVDMSDHSPIVDNNGNIYIGTETNGFNKYDQNLNLQWSFNPNNNSNFNRGSALISIDKYIYLNDSNAYILYCIDTNGYTLWNMSYLPSSGNYSTPCIGKYGLIYMTCGDTIQAFGN